MAHGIVMPSAGACLRIFLKEKGINDSRKVTVDIIEQYAQNIKRQSE